MKLFLILLLIIVLAFWIYKGTKEDYQNLDKSQGGWILDWQNHPEVRAKIGSKIFVLQDNKAYMTYGLSKEQPQIGPFTSDPDVDSMFIYSNNPRFQFETYGIKNKCNAPPDSTNLCNGFTHFTDMADNEGNFQFKQLETSNGVKYLIHAPTNLIVVFLTITAEMIDQVNKNLLDPKFAPWNYFTVEETPDIFFPVSTQNRPGDIISLVYVGNDLADQLPRDISIKLKNSQNPPIQTRLEIENEFTTDFDWLIRSNGAMTKVKFVDPGYKAYRLVPTQEKGQWVLVKPAMSLKCAINQIYQNGVCTNCPSGFKNDKNKLKCIPNCPSGQYLFGASCQKCDGDVSSDQLTCFLGGLKEIGTVDDEHVGFIQMSDGTWLPIGDVLSLIAGPEKSENECFRYLIETYGGCSWSAPWNCVVDAANWVAERAKDVARFAEEAVKRAGEWMKGAANSTLKWVEGAGKTIAKELIKFGNAFACGVRKAIREVGEFFNKFGKMALEAVNAVIKFFKDNIGKVFDVIKPILQSVFATITGGVVCQYIMASQLSEKDAIEALQPIILPVVRTPVVSMAQTTISSVFPPAAPFIAVILPLVKPYLDPQIDKLLKIILIDTLAGELIRMFDPIVRPLSFACPFLSEPEGVSSYTNIIDNTDFSETNIDIKVIDV
jgi:hypothetical protein